MVIILSMEITENHKSCEALGRAAQFPYQFVVYHPSDYIHTTKKLTAGMKQWV